MGKNIKLKNKERFIRLGIAISEIRKKRGMSQAQLAKKSNISQSYLSVIESSDIIRPFSMDVLYNIADALEVSPCTLIDITKSDDEMPLGYLGGGIFVLD